LIKDLQLENSSKGPQGSGDPEAALQYAVSLIDAVCCVSGSLTFVEDIQSNTDPSSLATSVANGDTPALFDWMMESFSYQGVSNSVAEAYLRSHGSATWRQIESLLARAPSCPRLTSYWTYDNCRYGKTSGCCSEPEHRDHCPVPTHSLRNGRLNQTAYSLYLFVRDIARCDLPRWIDGQLSGVDLSHPHPDHLLQEALVGPMRHIFGVSDKVLTMTLSEVLMAAPQSRAKWFRTGSQMIAVDTLVHNFLHRTGILRRFDAPHAYGAACYQSGRCADILRRISAQIDARRFNAAHPENFPRFIQHALWQYCAADRNNICNGNVIDDTKSCENIYCILYDKCSKIPLNIK
jgi:hypothetical protein